MGTYVTLPGGGGGGGGAENLDDLTDVDTVTDPPDDGDFLVYDTGTGKWAPATLTVPGSAVTVDASGFNGNLTTSDDTVQEVAQKLDDLSIPAAGIPASTIDGKGELLVGSANDAVDNLAIGTDGHVLTLDSAQTLGVKWAAASGGIADPGGANDDFLQRKAGAWAARTIAQVKADLGVIEKLPRTSGEYYTLGGNEVTSSIAGQAGSGAAGRMVAHPVWLPAGSYDRACVRTTVAAVATYRIGVYPNDAATMRPDGTTLILDCGTIDMNATAGLLSATVTLSIPTSGIYWLAILMDSYTAAPTAFGWNGNAGATPNLPYLGHRNISSVGGRGIWAALKTGVTTGSMPSTFPTSTAGTDIMPQILVRAT